MIFINKRINKDELEGIFYDCDSWNLLNSGNESVDVDELIEKLKEARL